MNGLRILTKPEKIKRKGKKLLLGWRNSTKRKGEKKKRGFFL